MATNVGNEFNIVLNATIDNNALQQELNNVRQRLLKDQAVKLNVEIDSNATEESLKILNTALKEFKTNIGEKLTLNVDDSKMKSVENSLKNQKATLNELNKALQERNRIESEIAKLQSSKTYNSTAQQSSLTAQQQLLAIENQRIESLTEQANKLGVAKDATSAKEKADLQLEAAQQRVASSSKQNIGFLQNMVSGLKEATARIFDYTIAYRAIAAVGQVFRESINDAIELDGVLVDLQIVTGGTRQEAEKLLLTYNEMAQELGSTTQAVAESANEFLRQGLSFKETNDMIEASQYLSKLGMIEGTEATQYITSATKGYGLAASEAMSVVDKLTKVDINAAVSSGYLAEAMSRTANSAQQAGVDMDTLIGYIATIGETTQRSASTVGESLKTMFARFGNVKAGVFASGESDMENLNDIEKVFGKLGITIRDSASEMRDVDDILGELAGKWSTLNDVEKNAVATAAAGVRQRENFLVLMNNYNTALGLEEESLNSAGTAAQKYEAYQNSVEAAMNRVTASFESMILQLNESSGISGLLNIADAVLQVVSNSNVLTVAIGALAGVLGGKLLKSVSGVVGKFQDMKATSAGLTSAIKNGDTELKSYEGNMSGLLKVQKKHVVQAMLEKSTLKGLTQEQAQAKLVTLGLTQAEAKSVTQKMISNNLVEISKDGIIGETTARGAQVAVTKTATAAQVGLNTAANAFPFAWIFAAIGAIVSVVTSLAGSAESATDKWEKLNDSLSSSQERLDDYNQKQEENKSRMEELNELAEERVLSLEEESELLQLQAENPWLDTRIEAEEKLNELLKERLSLLSDDAFDEGMKMEMTGFDSEGLYNFVNVMTSVSNFFQTGDWKWVLDEQAKINWDEILNGDQALQIMQNYSANYETWVAEIAELEGQLTSATSKEEEKRIQDAINEKQAKIDQGTEYLGYLQSQLDSAIQIYGQNSVEVQRIQNRLFEATMVTLDKQGNAVLQETQYQNAVISNLMTNMTEETKSAMNVLVDLIADGHEINWDAWFNKEQFAGIKEALEEAGISTDVFIGELERMGAEMARSEGEAALLAVSTTEFTQSLEDMSFFNDAMSEYADSISGITDSVDILTDAQRELAEVGGITSDTLSSMADNNLLGYLDELYNGTFDATNAALDLEVATKQAAVAQIYEQTATQLSALAQAAKAQASGYSVDAEVAVGAAALKAAEMIITADGSMKDYTLDVADFIDVVGQFGIKSIDDFGNFKEQAQSVLDAANAQLAAIKISGDDINVRANSGGVNRRGGGTGSGIKKSSGSKKKSSGSKSSSSKTDNTDHWKEAFDKEYDTLKHNREMDIISEKEYLDQLEGLNKKYFAGRAKYLDEYRKYEEEVYKGRKKELEEQQKAEIEAAKEVYEAQKDAIKKQQDNLKDQLDAYKKIIDKRKELLSTMQEEKSYQDELTDKNNSILDLENRIAELRYDTSAEGTKKRLELEDELAKSVKEKEDYMYDHSVTAQQDALDKEYDNYSEFIDDVISKLDESLTKLEEAFEATTKAIEASFQGLIDALNDNAIDGGVAGGGGFGFGISNLSGQRGDDVRNAQQQLNNQYGAGLNVDGIWGSRTQAAYVRAVQNYLNDNFGAGLSVDGIWGSKTQAAWESAGGGAKPFHKGIEEGFVGGVEGNEMFAKLLNGELVTNEGQQNRFMDKILPQLLGNTAQAVTETVSNGVNIDMDFNVAGNMDENVIPQVRNAVKEIIDTYFIRGQKRNVRAFSL